MTKVRLALVAGLAAALLAAPSTAYCRQATPSQLQAIGDLMVRTWTGEGVFAADYPGVGKKGDKFTSTATCRWAAGKAAIACEGKDNQATWTSLYFWDPAVKQVRLTAVNSGGNFDQGTVTKQGDKLVGSTAGSFADGRKVEYKWETTFAQNGSVRVETGATILNGVRSEFRDTYKKAAK